MSQPQPSPKDSQEQLAGAARDLVAGVRTFEGPDDVATAVQAHIAAANELLAPHRWAGPYEQRSLRSSAGTHAIGASDDPMSFFPYSPVIGERNPVSPPARFWRAAADDSTDGADPQFDELRGEVTFGPAAVGPPHSVHGGIIALMFDELLGCTAVANDVGAHTGTLSVMYRSLTPAGRPLTMKSWISGQERRKVFVSGQLLHGETLCAEAEGIFVRMR